MLVAAWVGRAPALRAQPSGQPPNDVSGAADTEPGQAEAKAQARALFDLGARAYQEGRYYDAVDHFLDASRLYPNPKLTFNIAKAYDKLGNHTGALRFYREYLRGAVEAPDHADVRARTRELEQVLGTRGIQQVTVLSTPEGATVFLDRRAVGVTPWTGETGPGRHRLELELSGHERTDDVIEVDAHRSTDITIALDRAPEARPRTDAVRATDAEQWPTVRPLTWTALAVGTAGFGTALAIEMAAGGDGGVRPASAFFAGAGLASSVLGGVLLYVDLDRERPTARSVRVELRASPHFFAFGGRF